MNEKLEAALYDLIAMSTNAIDNTGNFLTTEMPDVIRQLLIWEFAKSIAITALGIVGIVSIIIYWFLVNKHLKEIIRDGYADASIIGGVIGSGFVFIPSILGISDFNWLKMWIAPKVWLISYAADLVK